MSKTESILSIAEFTDYLKSQWKKCGIDVKDGERVGISVEELAEHSRNRNASVSTPYLDLWMAAFDEAVSWLISLHYVFYINIKNREKKWSKFEQSIVVLLGRLIADSFSIRALILCGYDVAAKTVLRSTGEYAEVLVSILHDPELSENFVKADTPEAAKVFWRNHVADKAVRSKVLRAWLSFVKEDNRELAEQFASWGHSWHNILSGYSHASFSGAMFATIPFKTKHTDENWLGFWGDKADGSVDTISIYFAYMFPVIFLFDFPFSGYEGYIDPPIICDESDRMHMQCKKGRAILGSMILTLCSEKNERIVRPSFDLSIFSAEDED